MAIILSMDMIYSTMKGIVPSRCKLTTRHLGATLFKVEITSNMQVPCHCQHAPWHLGRDGNGDNPLWGPIEHPRTHLFPITPSPSPFAWSGMYIIQIDNMAGFLLWLSITSIMIKGLKVALAQWLLFLSMDMIYSTMEGIVPSRCRLTTRHLGATLFKLRLHASLMSLQACTMTLGG